jgi:hypothetical protein
MFFPSFPMQGLVGFLTRSSGDIFGNQGVLTPRLRAPIELTLPNEGREGSEALVLRPRVGGAGKVKEIA